LCLKDEEGQNTLLKIILNCASQITFSLSSNIEELEFKNVDTEEKT
jgi:hypothetical protein